MIRTSNQSLVIWISYRKVLELLPAMLRLRNCASTNNQKPNITSWAVMLKTEMNIVDGMSPTASAPASMIPDEMSIFARQ